MLITNDLEYNVAFARLDKMIAEGFEGNPEKEAIFEEIAQALEYYEDHVLLIPLRLEGAKTLPDMIRLKMFEMKLKQKELAKQLEVSETSLSAILNGKRRITIDFAKKLYTVLKIDPEFILQVA